MFDFSSRPSGRSLVVEFNPYQILVAEYSRARRGNIVLEAAAEFDRDNADGLRQWIDARENGGKSRVPAVCSLVPDRGILHRESIVPERLSEPGYLENFIEEEQKGRFLTATPFKIRNSRTWTFRALNAIDGRPLPDGGPAQPALVCAIANEETLAIQQRLTDNRIYPERIEPGLLSLFGAVYGHLERRHRTQAVVVVVVHQTATTAYILGKDGVQTPNPILHGLDSIIEAGRKETGEMDEDVVFAHLQNADSDLVKQGAKLVRRIGRDLKQVVDSFEMTTGQPVDEILCPYLPPNLNWLAEPLARSTGRLMLDMDCASWLPRVGVEIAEAGPQFGVHWLGALSVLANLPDTSSRKSRTGAGENRGHNRPWHLDCTVATEADDRKLAGRRFLTGAFAATFAALAIVFTAWQAYAIYSLRADTRHWEQELAGNRRLFESVNSANAMLKKQTAVLDRAYALMGTSFQPSDLFMDLGRTIPPHVQVDRIDINDSRVALSGVVFEAAEDASATLGRHMEEIRRHPALGALFDQVAITSLQRKTNSDAMSFELTLRLKPDAH